MDKFRKLKKSTRNLTVTDNNDDYNYNNSKYDVLDNKLPPGVEVNPELKQQMTVRFSPRDGSTLKRSIMGDKNLFEEK